MVGAQVSTSAQREGDYFRFAKDFAPARAITRLGRGRFSDRGNPRLVNGPRGNDLGATAGLLLLCKLIRQALLFQDLQKLRIELKTRCGPDLGRFDDHGGQRYFLLLSRKAARP
jgi:hypothetical protein